MATTPTAIGFRAPPAWVVFLFISLGVTSLGVAIFMPMRPPVVRTGEGEVVAPPVYPDAPPFVLTERLGTTVDNTALDGKVWVASFAFTRCKYCPSVTATMAKLRGEMGLTANDDFRLVTFTIDPEHDTPDELKKYADKFTGRANDPNWLFLHGSERYVRLLCQRGFKVGVEKKDDAPVELMYDHYLGLLLIDKKGRVRGTFMGKPPAREGDDKDVEAGFKEFDRNYAELKEKIGELLKE